MSRRDLSTEDRTSLPPDRLGSDRLGGERPGAERVTGGRIELPSFGRGLSARVLALTVVFVMLSEVLIYAPSIARFRLDWLTEKLASGHLATLALEATPDYMIDPQLELTLLQHAGARLVALHTPDGKNLMLRGATAAQLVINETIDLDDRGPINLITSAFDTMSHTDNRLLRVMGHSPRSPDTLVEVVLDDLEIRQLRPRSPRIGAVRIRPLPLTRALGLCRHGSSSDRRLSGAIVAQVSPHVGVTCERG